MTVIIEAQRVTMHETDFAAQQPQVYAVRVSLDYLSLMSKGRCGTTRHGGGVLRNMIGEVQLTREQATALRDELNHFLKEW
jgi:hypothetical protein